MKLKPECHRTINKILADARPTTSPAPAPAPAPAAPETRAATRPVAALRRAGNESLTAAWAWAASLDSTALPGLDSIQCVRRLPRSMQQDFDRVVSMVMFRLRDDPCDVAAHNILFLIPRIILRRDPAKSDTTHKSRAARDALLRDHELAMPAGDGLQTFTPYMSCCR